MLTSTCCHALIPTELVMQLVSKMPEGVGGSVEQLCVVGWLQPPCWSSGGIFSCTPISERTEGRWTEACTGRSQPDAIPTSSVRLRAVIVDP